MNTKRVQEVLRCVGLILPLAFAGGGTLIAQEADLDPVVEDVVEMLQAGVDERVVIQWLESTGRRPLDISPADMIALTEAKATGALFTRLLEGLPASTAEGTSAEPADLPPVGPAVEVSAAAPADAAPPAVPPYHDGQVQVVTSLRAKRVFTDEPEPDSPQEEPWHVFLYLDGDLVAWTRPSWKGDAVEARRVVTAGRHEMRVVLQRYEERRGGWLHESLAVPTLVVFELEPGPAVELEVEMRRIWGLWRQRQDGGPLRFVVRQGDRVLAENEGTGGDSDRWQPVCEDIEANFPDTDDVPRQFRSAMSRCVPWAELWTGVGRESSRAEILAELARHDFEPPVR